MLLTIDMLQNFSHWEEVFDNIPYATLFIYSCFEILSAAITNDPGVKISQYADDSSLILDDIPETA